MWCLDHRFHFWIPGTVQCTAQASPIRTGGAATGRGCWQGAVTPLGRLMPSGDEPLPLAHFVVFFAGCRRKFLNWAKRPSRNRSSGFMCCMTGSIGWMCWKRHGTAARPFWGDVIPSPRPARFILGHRIAGFLGFGDTAGAFSFQHRRDH